ncbi:MAG: hypothetical protein ABIA78_02155 [archaeon]
MKIISFDGMRASGKSTQLSKLVRLLEKDNKKIKVLHEKNYEPFRSLALFQNKNKNRPFYLSDVEDFAIARKAVYKKEVSPVEEKIDYLLFDRYFYTSAVYQRGILSMDEIMKINLQKEVPNPEKSFIFVCDPIISFERMKKRDNYAESISEISKRRELYLELSRQHPELYLIDTTDKTEDEVFEEVKFGLELGR